MRIAFWGNFGALNLGNECTLAAAIYNIRARLPQAELLAICREPADTVVRHGIGAIRMSQPREPYEGLRRPSPLRTLASLGREAGAWMRAFNEAGRIDALLVTGSGILSDEGEGTLGLPYELFKWSLVTKLRGKKLFFVSVGAESLTRRVPQALVKGALRLADYRSYRDSHSVRVMQGTSGLQPIPSVGTQGGPNARLTAAVLVIQSWNSPKPLRRTQSLFPNILHANPIRGSQS